MRSNLRSLLDISLNLQLRSYGRYGLNATDRQLNLRSCTESLRR